MKIIRSAWVLVSVYCMIAAAAAYASGISWEDIGRGQVDVRCVAVDPRDWKIVYTGSKNSVLKSADNTLTWRTVLTVRGEDTTVNYLLFEPGGKEGLYALTNSGLYRSLNGGNSWQRVFRGRNKEESDCRALCFVASTMYLGTAAGLFISTDKGQSWHRQRMGEFEGGVFGLACSRQTKGAAYVYAAASNGLYRTDECSQRWERVFAVTDGEDRVSGENIQSGDEDTEEKERGVRCVAVDPFNSSRVVLASARSVYVSCDNGTHWERLSGSGLIDSWVTQLALSAQARLYALSRRGIFEYEDGRWYELSFDLASSRLYSMTFNGGNLLYVACDKGLFRACILQRPTGSVAGSFTHVEGEPSIREVQEAAIAYAEVNNAKIALWRRQAALKAWLPQISVGIDRDVSDLWHWESGSTTKPDDDVLKKGNDSIAWDVRLSWDLGEIIWNNDQTSIDVRSRLMVELRSDVLDEVTKLYFERLRVKAEIARLPLEDRSKLTEKEIRLKELTAHLDGLTGGFFSRRVK